MKEIICTKSWIYSLKKKVFCFLVVVFLILTYREHCHSFMSALTHTNTLVNTMSLLFNNVLGLVRLLSHLSWDDLFYWACFAVCSRSNDDLSFPPFFSLSSSFLHLSVLSLSPPPSCLISLFLTFSPSFRQPIFSHHRPYFSFINTTVITAISSFSLSRWCTGSWYLHHPLPQAVLL